jgi:hypothetical protein
MISLGAMFFMTLRRIYQVNPSAASAYLGEFTLHLSGGIFIDYSFARACLLAKKESSFFFGSERHNQHNLINQKPQ